LIYEKHGLELTNFKLHTESADYAACAFELNGKIVEYRQSKITPKKAGQFVTIWKRNQESITAPLDITDGVDLVIISARSSDNFGQFIFPLSVLADRGIVSRDGKKGKRGIRVYPPWVNATNNQAEKTQAWQTEYFLAIDKDKVLDLNLIEKILF